MLFRSRKILAGLPLVIFGDGTQERSFTSVDDVVAANMKAAVLPNSSGETYNCASGINITIQELALEISRIAGLKDPLISYDEWTPGDIKKFDIDNSKICADFEMEFEKNFTRGLEKTWNWFKERAEVSIA